MDCSTSGLPVHHQPPEFIQTHSRMSHSKVGRLKVVWEGQDIWETTFLCGLEWASLTRLYFLPGSYWRWDVCPILGVHSTSNCPLSYYSSEAKVAQLCPTLCDTMGCSPPGSLSMEFSRQEYLSGLPFPSPGDLPNPGIKSRSPKLQTDSLLLSHQWSPCRVKGCTFRDISDSAEGMLWSMAFRDTKRNIMFHMDCNSLYL